MWYFLISIYFFDILFESEKCIYIKCYIIFFYKNYFMIIEKFITNHQNVFNIIKIKRRHNILRLLAEHYFRIILGLLSA